MKIYAPVKDFNGLRNGVRFVNGVGETDNPLLITWFNNMGYIVEKSVEKCDKSTEKSLKNVAKPIQFDQTEKNDQIKPRNDEVEVMGYPEQDFDEMTPNELREWAIENGLGSKIRNTRNKEKLLEIIRG